MHCSLQVPSDVDLLIIWPSFSLTPKWAIGLKKIPIKKPCVKNNTHNTGTLEQDGGWADVSSSMSSLSATSCGKDSHNLIRSELKSALKLRLSRDNLKHEFPITAVLMTSLALSVYGMLGLSGDCQKPSEQRSLTINKYIGLQRKPTRLKSLSNY